MGKMQGDDRYRYTYQQQGYQPHAYYYPPPQPQPPPPPPPGGLFSFSAEEKKNLLMAIGALTLAFTLLFSGSGIAIYIVVALSFVAVVTGFLLHEFGHKFVAQRYGCWAEFKAWPQGLLLAIFSAFFGFLFAAPGAVYIRGRLTKEQNGWVSAAGPLMNITVASFLLPVIFFVSSIPDEIFLLVWMICYLNVFIGGFNMIPFPPLDGSKIIRWNPGMWILLLAVLGFYFILLNFPGAISGLF
jgi:Zn-dependent protease